MHSKKIRLLFSLLLLLLSLAIFLVAAEGADSLSWKGLADGSLFASLDRGIASRLPRQTVLRQISLQLGLLGGQLEQNDIFISTDGLIKNIPAPNTRRIQRNVESVLRFSQGVETPVYLMLLPTASAILQHQVPQYMEIYNNQRQVIQDAYLQLSGKVATVDVYPTLFNHRDEYIYYRTWNNLTQLGGYHVYSVLGSRLIPSEVYDYSYFDIEYLNLSYYGDLYQTSPYQGVRPDILSLYHYTRFPREYMISTWRDGFSYIWHTLYPTWLVELGRTPEVYPGGSAGLTRIQSSSPIPRSLLVFTDSTASSWLPFLSNHYEEILVVNLSEITAEMLSWIHPEQYGQILFAYSVETFDSDAPALAEKLLLP